MFEGCGQPEILKFTPKYKKRLTKAKNKKKTPFL